MLSSMKARQKYFTGSIDPSSPHFNIMDAEAEKKILSEKMLVVMKEIAEQLKRIAEVLTSHKF